MNRIIAAAVVAAALAPVSAAAQSVASPGEASPVFSCIYECEPGLGVRTDWWGEVSLLAMENQNALRDVQATVVFLNAQEQMIARAPVYLSNEDVDIINVCRTLKNAGLQVPRAGAVEVILRTPQDNADEVGVYGWIKSFVGKFFVVNNDPFLGVIEGLATTQCRVTPPEVATVQQIQDKIALQQPPVVLPVYVSGTADP